MYVAAPQRRSALGATLGRTTTTIGELRSKIAARMKKLRSYDLFLRERTVVEWFKDNSAIVHWLVRNKDGRERHEESHAFWTHLSATDKRQLIARWVKLVDDGAKLGGEARQGGIGIGYGANEPAPPARAYTVRSWLDEADAFIAKFDGTRQKMKIEARVDPNPGLHLFGSSLKTIGWVLGIGVVGILAVSLISTGQRLPLPRLAMPGGRRRLAP